MKKAGYSSRTVFVLFCLTTIVLLPLKNVEACIRREPFTLDELFNNAEVIVRVTAVKYAKAPDDRNMMTTDIPDSTIEFRVEEKLRGTNVPNTIILNGYLNDRDDFNDVPVPYMFVRPLGRLGSCFANTYKEGAQFLLFLKNGGDRYTSNISALGPTNEQLHSDRDAWLVWVRNHLIVSTASAEHTPDGWTKINVCGISFSTPSDLKDLGTKGVDSCVAQFKNNDITLYLDYGRYGSPFRFANHDRDSKEQSLAIDGKKAQVITYIDSTHGNTGLNYNASLYVPVREVDPGEPRQITLMMSIIGERPKDQETALAIFRTIHFSDTPKK